MTSNKNAQNSTILEFFGRPAVGIAGSIASIIGIGLSVYLFFAAREAPLLSYFVHPAKASVVRTGQTSRVSVLHDGEELASDITAAQVAFWNAGRKAIRKEMILSPLVISTGKDAPILEARIRNASREVVEIALDTSGMADGELTIHWNILEHNDGGVLQLVYAGDEDTAIEAVAIVEGQSRIERLDYTHEIRTPDEQYARTRAWHYLLPAYFMLGAGVFALIVSLARYLSWRRRGSETRTFMKALFVQGVFMLAMGLWLILTRRPPSPPFGL